QFVQSLTQQRTETTLSRDEPADSNASLRLSSALRTWAEKSVAETGLPVRKSIPTRPEVYTVLPWRRATLAMGPKKPGFAGLNACGLGMLVLLLGSSRVA